MATPSSKPFGLKRRLSGHFFVGFRGTGFRVRFRGNPWAFGNWGPLCFPPKRYNEKKPGCLGYIGYYTTQLHGDYNKPWNKDPGIKQPVPGDSIRDLFIPDRFERVTFSPHHPKKVTFAELPGNGCFGKFGWFFFWNTFKLTRKSLRKAHLDLKSRSFLDAGETNQLTKHLILWLSHPFEQFWGKMFQTKIFKTTRLGGNNLKLFSSHLYEKPFYFQSVWKEFWRSSHMGNPTKESGSNGCLNIFLEPQTTIYKWFCLSIGWSQIFTKEMVVSPNIHFKLVWLVVEPTHLKNMIVNLEIFPNFRGENKK